MKEKNELYSELESFGYDIENGKIRERWDHNVITPGTLFMEKVSKMLKTFIIQKLETNPEFKDLSIIFSDSGQPKEGEHKILDFIRRQRSTENYDANQSHCIYGADADLIMLGLSTHEPNFFIIREKLESRRFHEKKKPIQRTPNFTIEFNFIKICLVREFMEDYMKNIKLTFPFDLENILDDFVLLCFIVGNDFLPCLPGFNIRMAGIDILVNFYRKTLSMMDGYLTSKCEVNLKNLEHFFKELARSEYQLLKAIEDFEFRSMRRTKERNQMELNRFKYDMRHIQKLNRKSYSKEKSIEQEDGLLKKRGKLEEIPETEKKFKKLENTSIHEIVSNTLRQKDLRKKLKNMR